MVYQNNHAFYASSFSHSPISQDKRSPAPQLLPFSHSPIFQLNRSPASSIVFSVKPTIFVVVRRAPAATTYPEPKRRLWKNLKKKIDRKNATATEALAELIQKKLWLEALEGGISMTKIRSILLETEDEKSYMDYCYGLDLYSNFTKAEEMEERLVKLREGVTLVKPEERKAIQELYTHPTNHRRRRKRMFKDLWDAITVNSSKDVKEFKEELGVEYDEDVGVNLQSFLGLIPQSNKRARGQLEDVDNLLYDDNLLYVSRGGFVGIEGQEEGLEACQVAALGGGTCEIGAYQQGDEAED
ncbi:hypothetical protein V2J09_013138 [Rumex salicifolius]